ncbi:MAG TPA: hypothetical protein PLX23_00075 [Candidatus Hydrogenedens sp.]|nr:hypothetical protein [Candidatus Hydrogenedens sp.]
MKRVYSTVGYILFEAVFSMALLSIAGLTFQSALRQAILTRGQANDYTTARFLLEQINSEIELQPQYEETEKSGSFPEPNDRFSYEWKISRISIPKPELPPEIPPELRENLIKMFHDYIAKVDIWIRWQRAGMKFEVHAQNSFQPEKLWTPEESQR